MPVRGIRRRYLSFKLISYGMFSGEEIADVIQKAVQKLYGINGISLISPSLIEYDGESQAGIIRCSHDHLRMMRASLVLTTEIGDEAASFMITRVSGTIKSLKRRQ